MDPACGFYFALFSTPSASSKGFCAVTQPRPVHDQVRQEEDSLLADVGIDVAER